MKTILQISAVILLALSCTQSNNKIDTAFNEVEAKTMYQIVDFYDEFVYSKTSTDLPVDSAYLNFLGKFIPKAYRNNDLGVLMPTEEEKLAFYESIDQGALAEIFRISDSTEVENFITRERKMVPYPYHFQLNYDGKYKQFLKAMSTKSDFFLEVYSGVEQTAIFVPAVFVGLIEEHKKMDFSSPDERLLLAVILLSQNKQVYYD